jgi:hypothetical protein
MNANLARGIQKRPASRVAATAIHLQILAMSLDRQDQPSIAPANSND